MQLHYHSIETCLARIFVENKDHQQIHSGMGVVLDGGSVLTCAHVVNPSLLHPNPLRADKEKPEKNFILDFPLSGSAQTAKATVGYWNAEEDLAELKLIDPLPNEIQPTNLHFLESLDHRVKAFGFPSKNTEGTWAECQLRGKTKSGWIEIFDPRITGNFIKKGFSGGPVWDEDSNYCIGIIVAVEKNDASRVGYLIPANKIAEDWKEAPIQQKPRSKQKWKFPILLPYQVNRWDQKECLEESCSIYQPETPLPIVTIIHGDENQSHEMFMLRLQLEIIPNLIRARLSTSIQHIHLPWPGNMTRIRELDKRLTRSLAESILYNIDASRQEIQDTLAKYNSPVLIDTVLLTEDWLKHKSGILESYLDYWQNWPNLQPGQNIFVFLFLKHKTVDTNILEKWQYSARKNKILRQISHCGFHHYPRIIGALLPELDSVSQADTEEWARTNLRKYLGEEYVYILTEISKLYMKHKKIPLDTLAQNLKEILISCSGDLEAYL